MLRQNCKNPNPPPHQRLAEQVLLRNDHLVLLAIDGLFAAHAAMKRWLQRRRTRRALAALEPRQLRDIGITDIDALFERRRWWGRPDKSRRALAELDDSQLSNLSEAGLKLRREARQAPSHG